MSLPPSLAALIAAAAVSAALAIRGHYGGPGRLLVYVFKPLTTLLLLAIALSPSGASGSRYAVAVAAGIAFSLAGDVFLMLPEDRFRQGLASFFVAHLCYLAAFTEGTGLLVFPAAAAAFGAVGILLLGALWPGVPRRLRVAVALYVVVILAMAIQATGRALNRHDASALLAFSGAALFVVSDTLLAWDRFRSPFRSSRAVVLATYFLAQALIALSVPLLRAPGDAAPDMIGGSGPGSPGAEVGVLVFPALVLAAVASGLPAPRPAQEGPQAPPRPVTCTFSNPAYSGYCKVTAPAAAEQSPTDACQEILACLNNVQCSKTYCNATQVRGGWKLVSAEEGTGR